MLGLGVKYFCENTGIIVKYSISRGFYATNAAFNYELLDSNFNTITYALINDIIVIGDLDIKEVSYSPDEPPKKIICEEHIILCGNGNQKIAINKYDKNKYHLQFIDNKLKWNFVRIPNALFRQPKTLTVMWRESAMMTTTEKLNCVILYSSFKRINIDVSRYIFQLLFTLLKNDFSRFSRVI